MAGIKLKNAFQAFNNRLFDPGNLTDENISRNRDMADMLLNKVTSTPVAHPLQGYALLAQALNAQAYRQRANKGETALKEQRAKELGGLMNSLSLNEQQQGILNNVPEAYRAQVATQLASQSLMPPPVEKNATFSEGVLREDVPDVGPKGQEIKYSRRTDDSGNVELFVQTSKGEVPLSQSAIAPRPRKGITVNTGDNKPQTLPSGAIPIFEQRREVATSAQLKYKTAGEMEELLDKGIFNGMAADLKQQTAAALRLLSDPNTPWKSIEPALETLANTEQYKAKGGVLVGSIIRLFGSGTGLSDADREYAAAIAGALTSTSEPGLRGILQGIRQQSEYEISQYNHDLDAASEVYSGVKSLFRPIKMENKTAEDYMREAGVTFQ